MGARDKHLSPAKSCTEYKPGGQAPIDFTEHLYYLVS